MKIYLLPNFEKWAKKEKVTYSDLNKTAYEVVRGLHDGDLGSGCYKKRISINSRGKRSGARTIISYKIDNFIIYIYMLMLRTQKAHLLLLSKLHLNPIQKIFL